MTKFRGNRKDDGEEVKGDLSIGSAKHGWDESVVFIIPRQPLLSRIEVIPESVAQYTTINDKKDVEIYGSVRINGKMSKGGDLVETASGWICSIGWNDYYAKWVAWDLDDDSYWAEIPIEDGNVDGEVIGKQYDEKGKK